MSAPVPDEAVALLGFWREAGAGRWYAKSEAFDAAIRSRFADLHAAAAAGGLADWLETAEGALASVILLDQFSRHLYRGDARSFAQDEQARHIAALSFDAGFDTHTDPPLRAFFYLPFMHSEALADQDRSVTLCHAIPDRANLPYARDHRRIIRRFGRFPHRNVILGRHTTAAEQAFLDEGGFAG